MNANPLVKGFYDERTGSIQYVVSDPDTRDCAIIDPVLDYDEKSGSTKTSSADAILAYVESERLMVQWILDTHPHADHFSAAAYLKGKTGAPTAIGAKVVDIQKLWQKIYNMPEMKTDSVSATAIGPSGTRRCSNMEYTSVSRQTAGPDKHVGGSYIRA